MVILIQFLKQSQLSVNFYSWRARSCYKFTACPWVTPGAQSSETMARVIWDVDDSTGLRCWLCYNWWRDLSVDVWLWLCREWNNSDFCGLWVWMNYEIRKGCGWADLVVLVTCGWGFGDGIGNGGFGLVCSGWWRSYNRFVDEAEVVVMMRNKQWWWWWSCRELRERGGHFQGFLCGWDFKGFFVCVSVNGFAWLYIEENEKLFGEKVPKVSCL